MKRFVLEATVGGLVLLALGYFHWQLNRLDNTQSEKRETISRLETRLQEANLILGNRLKNEAFQGDTIALLEKRLEALNEDYSNLKSKLANQTNQVNNRVKEVNASLTQIKKEKEELAWKLKRLGHLEKGYGTVNKVEGMLKTQEAALDKLRQNIVTDKTQLIHDLLDPSVKINGPDTVGSATLIYCDKGKKEKEWDTYLFTSYHVVRNIFNDIASGEEKVIQVSVYANKGTKKYQADMVAHYETIDIALLKLRTKVRFHNLAIVADEKELDRIGVFTPIIAVGCPLGNDPLPTQGSISNLDNKVAGANYWMLNAPTYLGNSGGGVFLASSRRLLGVFSKIYTHGTLRPNLVPHLGLCTPMPAIIKWLKTTKYKFIIK